MKLLLFVLILIVSFVHAEDFLQTIQLTGNECLSAVTQLKSGDLMASGFDFNSNDILLMRLRSDGTVLQAHRLSGALQEGAQAIVATSKGSAVVVGSTDTFGEGNFDGFILKVSKAGKVSWKRAFGTSGNEHFVRIVETSDRGFIVLGDADHDPNLNDVVVFKFNSKGKQVWRKVFSAGAFDHVSGLARTSDNGAIIIIEADLPEGARSVLFKLRSDGSVEWSRVYGTSGSHLGLSVIQAQDGGYYFSEIHAQGGATKSGTVIAKLDSEGNPIWSRFLTARGFFLSLHFSSKTEHGLQLAGNTRDSRGGDGVVIGLDENGRTLWKKKVKPDQRPVFLGLPYTNPSDGSMLIAGCAGELASNDLDSLVVRVQNDGTISGGCSKLKKFKMSNRSFQLTSSTINLQEIPVPFFSATAGFDKVDFEASESRVCSSE